MLDNLKASFNSIFEIYREKSRWIYNFNLLYVVVSYLFSAVFSMLFILIMNQFGWVPDSIYYTRDHSFDLLELFASANPLIGFVFILCFGLYAIYLGHLLESNENKPSLKEMLKSLESSSIRQFFLISLLISLCYLVLFGGIFPETNNYNSGLLRSMDLFAKKETWETKSYHWFNKIISLIQNYLPYIGALYLVVATKVDQPIKALWKYRINLVLVFLIVAFSFDAIFIHAEYFISQYISTLIKIPFQDEIPTGIFMFLTYVLIGAFFIPAAGGAVLFPVLNEPGISRQPEKDADGSTDYGLME